MAFNTQYADKLHQHVIIWLDDHIGEVGNNEVMKERFRRVTYPLRTFCDVNSTVAFICEQEKPKISVFLIVSGKLAHEILPMVFPLDCLVYVFIVCGDMTQHIGLASEYINKVLMFDSDEDLLIRVTNGIANHLMQEAEKCTAQNQFRRAAGLLDWADWLYKDADMLRHAACVRFRKIIQERRQELGTDHGIEYPNQFSP